MPNLYQITEMQSTGIFG